jgi:N-acetyl-gamma-glutamyl-phosphate reductase
MGVRAAVAGASGYAGGELLRLLLAHPDLEPVVLAAGSQAGERVGDVHPHLPELADRTFQPADPDLLAGADVTFLALPHGTSTGLAPALRERGATVVDLGQDFRHAAGWPYGLPELPGVRAALAGSRQVAVPGCYPTAVALALAPLLAADCVEPDDVVVVAASGASGAGRGNVTSGVMGDLTAYKVARHQHAPEIAATLGIGALSFTTVLAPMPRGILATCTATLTPGTTEAGLRAALAAAYDGEPFVHLLPEGRWPHSAATAGSNACHLQVTADVAAGRAVVVSAIDNLGKGAAGQAVQCANLMLGLTETAGLAANGTAP